MQKSSQANTRKRQGRNENDPVGDLGGGLIVETWPIGRLQEYSQNPRKNDNVVDKMVTAIQDYGFRIPIVARSDGTVVDGHLRLKAARKMGLETVPVALADDLTEAQVKAFRILANKSAEWAAWDRDLLRLELRELKAVGFELAPLGFTVSELRPLLGEDNSVEKRQMRDGMNYQVVIECESESHQAEILGDLQKKGLKCRPLIL